MQQTLIYGTTNPAKLAAMRKYLAGLPINISGLDEYTNILRILTRAVIIRLKTRV
jgi:hypothetical protein